jgi:hypothetical protein
MMINSKKKGASFEREVCRRLSLWLSGGESDSLIWRSAMSGGRATIQANSGKINLTQSGDVSAVGRGAYEFCERTFVEVKHYRDLSIARGFVCATGTLAKFWEVAQREAFRHGKAPLLVARQNLYPTLAITRANARIFNGDPIIELRLWSANVYLFDDVTKVVAPKSSSRLKRRSSASA